MVTEKSRWFSPLTCRKKCLSHFPPCFLLKRAVVLVQIKSHISKIACKRLATALSLPPLWSFLQTLECQNIQASCAAFWILRPLITCTAFKINFSLSYHHCVSTQRSYSWATRWLKEDEGELSLGSQLVLTRNLDTETSCFHKH